MRASSQDPEYSHCSAPRRFLLRLEFNYLALTLLTASIAAPQLLNTCLFYTCHTASLRPTQPATAGSSRQIAPCSGYTRDLPLLVYSAVTRKTLTRLCERDS